MDRTSKIRPHSSRRSKKNYRVLQPNTGHLASNITTAVKSRVRSIQRATYYKLVKVIIDLCCFCQLLIALNSSTNRPSKNPYFGSADSLCVHFCHNFFGQESKLFKRERRTMEIDNEYSEATMSANTSTNISIYTTIM